MLANITHLCKTRKHNTYVCVADADGDDGERQEEVPAGHHKRLEQCGARVRVEEVEQEQRRHQRDVLVEAVLDHLQVRGEVSDGGVRGNR